MYQLIINNLFKVSVGVVFIVAILLFYSNPDQFVSDSSLFYPVVAENIWTTGVSTFNGYIETNGYQPLWMLVSVVSIAISSLFSIDVLMTIGFFYHLFLLGAIVIIYQMARKWPFYNPNVVSLVLVFMFISNGVLHNMESAMALFFVLLTLHYALSIKEVTSKTLFLFGLLVGLTFLSRLDLIFFGLIVTGYLFFVWRKALSASFMSIAGYLLGLLLVTLPYLVYNLATFDHILPMFARLDEGVPTLSYAWANIYPYGAVSLVIAMVEWGIALTARTREARVIILVMSISTIFQIAYVAFFQHPQSWYFITGFINFAVIMGYLLQKFQIRWLSTMVFAGLVVVTIGSAYLKTVSNYALSAHVLRLYQDKVGTAKWTFSEVSEKRKFIEVLQKVLPSNATVMTWYFPGSLAYYGKMKVFAANGLSNGILSNNIYDRALLQNGVEQSLKSYGLQYTILPFSRGNVLWYGRLGYRMLDDNESALLFYSKLSSDVCAMMQYSQDDKIIEVPSNYSATGVVGVFPVKKMVECLGEAKHYKKSVFYNTVIEK